MGLVREAVVLRAACQENRLDCEVIAGRRQNTHRGGVPRMATSVSVPVVPARDAAALLLSLQGLSADPSRRATPAAVRKQIESMGFVQVDTISVVERAHHHILLSRFDDYRPAILTRLLERDRTLFEHWTHDASVIPTAWYPHWKPRFARHARPDSRASKYFAASAGRSRKKVLDHVLGRVREEGPLRSKDFEHKRPRGQTGAWWNWKPQKAALEYLWWTGQLAVTARESFQKVYDLPERVHPDGHAATSPDVESHVDWACRSAIERLGIATPSELAAFLNAINLKQARAWCIEAIKRGDVVEVDVESMDDSRPKRSVARPDWRRRLGRIRGMPDRVRALSPFDPVARDRDRMLRLFGFHYRFEAFVPKPKREYGYYVLPLLDGDRLVGRVDPKLHRDRGELVINGVWWEPGIRPTRPRRARTTEALERYAHQIGAEHLTLPSGW